MSEPKTYVYPWAGDIDPVRAACWAQYAGECEVSQAMAAHMPGHRRQQPAYSYYLTGEDADPVTGILAPGGMGLADPITGLDRGIGKPRGDVVPECPPEPPGRPDPCRPDQVEPGFELVEGTGGQPRPGRPAPKDRWD